MSSFFKKQAELVAFLIPRWLTECDQPEWGPAGDAGIMLKDPNPPKEPAIRHNWWRYPAPFYNQQAYFLCK